MILKIVKKMSLKSIKSFYISLNEILFHHWKNGSTPFFQDETIEDFITDYDPLLQKRKQNKREKK